MISMALRNPDCGKRLVFGTTLLVLLPAPTSPPSTHEILLPDLTTTPQKNTPPSYLRSSHLRQ